MAASGWDEIQALQAALAKTQSSSTSHRLSERNCVELVAKLVQKGLIEVIHTCDGREYLTPKQLEREIRDELIVQGGRWIVVVFVLSHEGLRPAMDFFLVGRVNLVDLQQVSF